jgi:hypothetical protein
MEGELGLHTADLFAIAAIPVPDDLAPLDPYAGGWACRLARHAVDLPVEKRSELRRLVASLPQEERVHPPKVLAAHQYYLTLPGPGAILMRMLANRNVGWTGVAKLFLVLTGRYWSAATYGAVGRGRKELTPDLLVDYSTLLGIPARDLAALIGMTLTDALPAPRRSVEEVPELIWDVRRLTADQVKHVADVAKAYRGDG